MKTILKKFFNAKEAWIFFICGLFLYYLGYYEYKEVEHEVLHQVLIKFGDVFIIGVILGYITNVSALFGVFKKELEDIVYAKEFLKKRTDLENIWENVTKELFKSKFLSIHKELLNCIKKYYLPIENPIYYNDYCISIDLDWVDAQKKILKSTTSISFDVFCENEKPIELPINNWICSEGMDSYNCYSKITKSTVNNCTPKVIKNESKPHKNMRLLDYVIELNGSTKYDIMHHIEKQYCLLYDYTICFKARYIVNNLTVQIRHPSDIKTLFLERGTIKEFSKINSTNTYLEMKYKGLILPEQGYVIILNHN